MLCSHHHHVCPCTQTPCILHTVCGNFQDDTNPTQGPRTARHNPGKTTRQHTAQPRQLNSTLHIPGHPGNSLDARTSPLRVGGHTRRQLLLNVLRSRDGIKHGRPRRRANHFTQNVGLGSQRVSIVQHLFQQLVDGDSVLANHGLALKEKTDTTKGQTDR